MDDREGFRSDRLPTPVAELVALVQKTDEDFPDSLERRSRLLLEATVQYANAVLLAAWRGAGLASREVETKLKALVAGNPEFGRYRGCLQATAGAIRDRPDAFFGSVNDVALALGSTCVPPEVERFRDCLEECEFPIVPSRPFRDVGDALDFLGSYRNGIAHDEQAWFDRNVARVAGPYSRAVLGVISSMDWLQAYPLFAAAEARRTGRDWVCEGRIWQGETPRRGALRLHDEPLPLDEVVFDPQGAALSLYPLLLVLPCQRETCRGRRVFLVARNLAGGPAPPSYLHLACSNACESPQSAVADALHRVFCCPEPPRRAKDFLPVSSFERHDVHLGEPILLTIDLANHKGLPIRDVSVEMDVPEDVEPDGPMSEEIPEIPPGGRASVEFRFRCCRIGFAVFHRPRLRYRLLDEAPIQRAVTLDKDGEVRVSLDPFPVLVGRERQLEILRHQFLAALAGPAKVVTIQGQSLAGKTALAEAFQREIGTRAVDLWTDCADLQRDEQGPLVDLLRDYVWRHGERAGTLRLLERRVGRSIVDQESLASVPMPDLLEVVAQLLDVNIGTLPRGAQLLSGDALLQDGDPRGGKARLCAALRDIYLALCRRPLVLFIDNMQLMHEDTWELIETLWHGLDRKTLLLVAILGPTRTDPETAPKIIARERLCAGLAKRRAVTLEVGPVPGDALSSLLDAMLPRNDFSADARATLLRFAEGQPSLLAQLVQTLFHDGSLEWGPHGYRLCEAHESAALSRAFAGLIRGRLDEMAPPLRKLVEHAAVLGRKFRTDLLAGVLGRSGDPTTATETDRRLEDIETMHHFLRRKDVDWEFVHEEIQRTIYEVVDPDERERIHRSAAAVLEQRPDNDSWCSDLIHHWTRCRVMDRVRYWLEVRAERLAAIFSYKDAAADLRRALEIAAAEPADRRSGRDEHWQFEITRELSRILWLDGEVQESARLDQENITLGRRLGRWKDVCELHLMVSSFHMVQGNAVEAERWAQTGREIAADRRLEEQKMKLDIQLGVLARRQRRLDVARLLFESCAATARQTGHRWIAAHALRHLGVVHRMRGDPEEAYEHLARAAALFNQLSGRPRLYGLATTYNNMIAVSLAVGAFERARHELGDARDCIEQIEDAFLRSRLRMGEAQLHLVGGAADAALACIDAAIGLKTQIGDREGIAMAHQLAGDAHAQAGRWVEAESRYQEARRTFEDLRLPGRADAVRVRQAALLLRRGFHAEAENAIRNIGGPRPSSPWSREADLDCAVVRIDLALDARAWDDAERQLDTLLGRTRPPADAALRAELDLRRAALLEERGKHEEALAVLVEASASQVVREHRVFAIRFAVRLGRTFRRAGRFDQAMEVLDRAVREIGPLRDSIQEAVAKDEMGEVELARGRPDAAAVWFGQAFAVKESLRDEQGARRSRELLGRCSR